MLIVIILLFIVVGCTENQIDKESTDIDIEIIDNSSNEIFNNESMGSDKTKKKILRIAKKGHLQTLDSANVVSKNGNDSFEVLANTMLGLFRSGKNSIETGMVNTYETSDNGLTWTFSLKENVKWSNGELVDAHDFVYAFQRLVNPSMIGDENSQIQYTNILNYSEIVNGVLPIEDLGITAIDRFTLVINLSKPTYYLEKILSEPLYLPVNREFCELHENDYGSSIDKMLFNGPFTVIEWNESSTYKLARNINYYDASRIELEEIHFIVNKDFVYMASRYEKDEIDMIYMDSSKYAKRYSRHDDYRYREIPVINFLRIRNEGSILENINARKAIAYALKRNTLEGSLSYDYKTSANYIIPKGAMYNSDGEDLRSIENDYYNNDNEMAKKYWEKAKEELKLEELSISIISYDYRKVTESIKEQLEDTLTGCIVELKPHYRHQPIDVNESVLMYDFAVAQYCDPITFLERFSTDYDYDYRDNTYHNTEYNLIIEKIKNSRLSYDSNDRLTELLKAEHIIIMDDAKIFPLAQSHKKFLQKPNVSGLGWWSMGYPPYFTYWNVKIE